MSSMSCLVDGCEGKVHHRALCGKHYRIAREKNIFVSRGFVGPKMHCTVEGCIKPRRDGYKICRMHSHRKTRHGETLGALPVIADKKPMQVGAAFGQLIVASYAGDGIWQCDCECGGSLSTTASNLHRGRAVKCNDDDAHYEPSYNRAHRKVKRERGSASGHQCVDCGITAEEWSYDHLDPSPLYERESEKLFPYSMDPARYSPRCIADHRSFDAALAASPPFESSDSNA